MMLRFADAGCMPSATARFHAPAYHAHETPFAESVSPIVLAVCGGSGNCAGSARSGLPLGAGGTPVGWYAGRPVLAAEPSGEIALSEACTGPIGSDFGESG